MYIHLYRNIRNTRPWAHLDHLIYIFFGVAVTETIRENHPERWIFQQVMFDLPG